MPYTTRDIPGIESDIAAREERIEGLRTNPPAGWAPRYVTHHIEQLKEEITKFEKIIEKIRTA